MRSLARDGFAPARRSHGFTVDMRYVGQSFTLGVALGADRPDMAALRQAFDARHAQTFGHAATESDAEIVNLRAGFARYRRQAGPGLCREEEGEPLIERRPVWFGDGWTDCSVLARARMAAGYGFAGPAIVEETGGTSVVPPGWQVTVHASGAMICRFGG